MVTIPEVSAVTGRVVGRAGASVVVPGSADGTAVAVTRSVVVVTPPGAGGVEAWVVVPLGGTGVDETETWVVVSWPKAIPKKRKKNIISGEITVLPLMCRLPIRFLITA